jgi:hypothetical protein
MLPICSILVLLRFNERVLAHEALGGCYFPVRNGGLPLDGRSTVRKTGFVQEGPCALTGERLEGVA